LSDPRILIVATLDTKGEEAAYLAERIEARGRHGLVIDAGILGEPTHVEPDVTRDRVAAAAGRSIEDVRAAGARAPAVSMMVEGLQTVVPRLVQSGEFEIEGGVGIGGAEGALLAAAALSVLRFGTPKVIVTPIASGTRTFGPFVGERDIAMLHSVVDLQGLNRYTATILDVAASMVTNADRDRVRWPGARRGRIGMSLNGNTTRVGTQIRRELESHGYEVVSFHSNGVGGVTMERMAAAGEFDALIDLTTNELVEELVGGLFPVRDRLRIAGKAGVPRVLVPGCLDFVCQAAGGIDERFRGLPVDAHNPEISLVRLDLDRAVDVARTFVQRALESVGPVRVVIPTRGLSLGGSPRGSFVDARIDEAVTKTLVEAAGDALPVKLVEAAINDEETGSATVAALGQLMEPMPQS
jgi:uncharacterized protein (UPF0261 family)